MSSTSGRDPVEVLADEFVQRRRRGERPSLTEYVERFPQWASEIRNVFPALVALEQAGPARERSSAGLSDARVAQTRRLAEAIGDYQIIREIGRGAMGIVYEAEQQSLDRRVALKVLPWHATDNAKAVERFRREARAAARLHHTNIVPVFDVGQEGDVCYYAMQFIQGQSLDRVLVELRRMKSGEAAAPLSFNAERWPSVNTLALSLHEDSFGSSHVLTPERQISAAESGGERPIVATLANDDGRRDSRSGIRPADSSAAIATQLLTERQTEQRADDTSRLARAATLPDVRPTDSQAPLVQADQPHFYRNVAHITQQAAEALAYAHSRGVIHRDVKPSNLLLDAAGVVWVTDFGLAKTDDQALTRSGDLLGTLRYMAPERFDGQCDGRADVYSLGITLYELLLLRPAHSATDGAELIHQITRVDPIRPRIVDRRVPRDLEMIVLKAIDREPAHRYQSAGALADDLRRYLQDEPILGQKVPLPQQFARWARRNRTLAAVTIGIAGLLVAAAVVSAAASASFNALARREHHARLETTGNLYHALVREAQATRLARREEYKSQVWALLDKARELETEAVDRDELRREAIQSLGDFVGEPPVVLDDFPAEVTCVAADGSGSVVAIGLADGTIRWHHPLTGKRLSERKEHAGAIDQLLFQAENETLVSADAHGVVKSWKLRANGDWQASDVATVGKRLAALTATRHGTLLAAYRVQAGYPDLVVEDLTTREKVYIQPSAANAMALSPDGNMLAAVGDDEVQVWSTRSGDRLEQTTTQLGPVLSASFSRDNRLLLCACDQGMVVYDLPELRQQTFMRYDQIPLGTFGSDTAHVAIASLNRRITLWNIQANRELATLTHPGWKNLHSLVFAENGRLLACGDAHAVRIWNLAGGGERLVLAGHAGAVNGVTLSRDGRRMASVGKDRLLAVWDTKSGERVGITSMPGMIQAVAFSTDGTLVAAGDWSGKLSIFDAATLDLLAEVNNELGRVHAVRFSPDRQHLLACGDQGLGIWRMHRTEPEPAGEAGERKVWTERVQQIAGADCYWLAVSRDGKFAAWVDQQRTVKMLELPSGREWPVSAPRLLRGWHNLAFHPDGEHLLLVDTNGQLVAWNYFTDRADSTLGRRQQFQSTHLAVSANGRWAAVDALPLQVGLWDLDSQQPFMQFHEEPSAVSATAWSDDSRQLAVGTKDGGLAIWNLPEIRRQLATIDLQWDEADGQAAKQPAARRPLDVVAAALEADPDDAHLRFRRSTLLARADKVDEAIADLTALLDEHADDRRALQSRANLYAARGRWKEAAADYRKVVDESQSWNEWYLASLVLARAGDELAYREHVRQMLGHFGDDHRPPTVERLLRASLLMPGAVPLKELPIGSLQRGAEQGSLPDGLRSQAWATLALAALRDNDADRALRCLREAQDDPAYSKTPALQALVFYLLAIAQDDLRADEAAESSLRAALQFARSVPEPAHPLKYLEQGHDRVLLEIVERQAKHVLRD